MTKARAFGAYVATVVLLLLGAAFAWQFYVMMIQPLGPNSTIIAWGVVTKLWVFDLLVAILAAASFAGAVAIMVRRPRAAQTA